MEYFSGTTDVCCRILSFLSPRGCHFFVSIKFDIGVDMMVTYAYLGSYVIY